MEIRGMQESDWPEVSRIISEEWELNHPVLDRDFFLWQHRGFGPIAGLDSTALALKDGRVIGMRGVIPGVYQIPKLEGGYEVLPGGSFAMWIVEQSSRGTGVGRELLARCEKTLPVMVAMGSNESTSVPIYLKAGFHRKDDLHHWFVLLEDRGSGLIYGPESNARVWKPPRKQSMSLIEIFDPQLAANIWSEFSKKMPIFSLHRNADFWRWRYLQHPTFQYRIFVDRDLTSLAVTRFEDTVVGGTRIRVLRIIEVITSLVKTDASAPEERLVSFLNSLLTKALEAGASAADYRCSSTFFDSELQLSGFKLSLEETGIPHASGFAGQLNPLVLGPRPINLHWKIRNSKPNPEMRPYFVKSDNDMDRPNRRGRTSGRLSS